MQLYNQTKRLMFYPATDSRVQNNFDFSPDPAQTQTPSTAGQLGHVCQSEHTWPKSVYLYPPTLPSCSWAIEPNCAKGRRLSTRSSHIRLNVEDSEYNRQSWYKWWLCSPTPLGSGKVCLRARSNSYALNRNRTHRLHWQQQLTLSVYIGVPQRNKQITKLRDVNVCQDTVWSGFKTSRLVTGPGVV